MLSLYEQLKECEKYLKDAKPSIWNNVSPNQQQGVIKMNTSTLIYDPSKRNLKLREKIENEMFINRSISQEAAYKYIMTPKIPDKNSKFSLFSIIVFVIVFLTYCGLIIVK